MKPVAPPIAFDQAVPDSGYRWWYVDGVSADGRFGVVEGVLFDLDMSAVAVNVYSLSQNIAAAVRSFPDDLPDRVEHGSGQDNEIVPHRGLCAAL